MSMSDYDKENVDSIMQGEGTWFGAQLLRLIARADGDNREALRLGFPEQVQAVEDYMFQGRDS